MQSFDRLLMPIRRRLALMVSRAVVTLVNDAAKMQTLQVSILDDETFEGAEHWQPYGFTTVPHVGAEALLLSVGGHRAHSIVVSCADRRYRLTGLQDGEVAIYTDEQDKIHLKRGREIEIETLTLTIKAAQSVGYDTPVITTTGRIVAQGDVVAGGVSLMQHPHGGVQAGPAQTGTPIAGGGA
jgi:phage baseplate assembly protein V